MNIISKELIPNKEWIVKSNGEKIGSITKAKKGYNFIVKGNSYNLKEPSEIGIELPNKKISSTIEYQQSFNIYDYPCSSKPFGPIYNIQKKLPIFTKSQKSKSHFCAGYYLIKFRKGWVRSFCPKLITLERYQYLGPFKNEQELKQELSSLSKI